MKLAQAGDGAAYRALLENLRPWIRSLHAAHCSQADADDLVQETLLAIHQKRQTYDPAHPFLPWAAAIARYKRIDFFRHRHRLREIDLGDEAETHMPQHLRSPDATLSEQQHREEVEQLLQKLPAEQQQLIRAVKLEGISIQEAAVRFSRSIAWVKVNTHRAIKSLSSQNKR